MKTIGQLIGVVSHTFSVKNDHNEKAQVTMKFDFTSATDTDIIGWLVGNRAIAVQRPLRALTVDEIKAKNNALIIAQNAGQRVKSKAEIEAMATQAIANMDKVAAKALLEKILAESEEEEEEEEVTE